MKEGLSYITLKNIAKIIKEVELEVNQIMEDSSLEKPIAIDIVQSRRNMAYNEIKAEVKRFKKKAKEIKE